VAVGSSAVAEALADEEQWQFPVGSGQLAVVSCEL